MNESINQVTDFEFKPVPIEPLHPIHTFPYGLHCPFSCVFNKKKSTVSPRRGCPMTKFHHPLKRVANVGKNETIHLASCRRVFETAWRAERTLPQNSFGPAMTLTGNLALTFHRTKAVTDSQREPPTDYSARILRGWEFSLSPVSRRPEPPPCCCGPAPPARTVQDSRIVHKQGFNQAARQERGRVGLGRKGYSVNNVCSAARRSRPASLEDVNLSLSRQDSGSSRNAIPSNV